MLFPCDTSVPPPPPSSFIALSAFYLANLYGPPPPSADAIKYLGITGWLFPVWAWWIDRNRELRRRPTTS